VAGVKTDFNALLGPEAKAMGSAEKDHALESELLHVPVSQRTQMLIESQTATDPDKQMAELRQVSVIGKGQDPLAMETASLRGGDLKDVDPQEAIAAGLILGSPEFQRR
jgi:hypothetical protein